MKRAVFGIVGAGWRAEFFLRAAKELPEFFHVSIVVERNPEKAKRLERQWGVKVLPDLDALAKCREEVEFVVMCLSPDVMPAMLNKASVFAFFPEQPVHSPNSCGEGEAGKRAGFLFRGSQELKPEGRKKGW